MHGSLPAAAVRTDSDADADGEVLLVTAVGSGGVDTGTRHLTTFPLWCPRPMAAFDSLPPRLGFGCVTTR